MPVRDSEREREREIEREREVVVFFVVVFAAEALRVSFFGLW